MDEERKAGNHQLSLEGRRLLRAGGVLDVDSFDEKTVVILTDQGVLTVEGEDLHINHLNVESGEIIVEGAVDGLHYADLKDKNGGLFKGLFR